MMINKAARWEAERVEKLNLRYAHKTLGDAGALERMIVEGGGPLDRALSEYERARPAMGKNDRKVLSTAVYGFARNRNPIQRALPDAEPGQGAFLTLALIDRLTPEAREPLLDALTREALDRLEAVRAECLSLLKEALAIPLPEADEKVENALSTLFSVPGFWIEEGPWRTAGEAFEELSVGRTPQSVHLRVNVARARREEILEEFYCSASVEARPSGRSPWGIVLPRRIDLRNLRAWREGLLEIQDEGSQLVAALCRPLPDGAKILDFCAGGGGKALALASEVFRQGGRVTAHDADASRLRRTLPRLARSGLSNLNLVEKVKDLRLKSFDLVLVDAPCSSSGTIRRNPEIPWRWTREKIHRLSETQVGVLEKASEFVKPGGKLVYATCSLLRPENEGSIEAFLSRNEEFKLEPFPKPNPVEDLPGVSDGRVRLPLNLSEYDGDSFFVARLARRG